ncbi:type III-A CRISPR-associated RAMP protein Csm3 [Helicobacter cetorum]|uniref:CRISPR system Cms endoribonuclease Csm3 n=1 Tax=Helicobacter cetorum (strain ATCC BAA-429 / MIT 00-7128) TaxID=182217 RepID=I0EP17_HELC0|nr:type III-A CRISPR-associated RAMP protein Csm3 [Helicobacter cetorum]AFI04686.1 CRISPR-associated RAMP protein, Csm3 family [Helicobacter cetorum MIT 00-7128]
MTQKTIKTTIKLLSGLHIGGSDDTMKIGGIDNSVIKREILSDDDGNIVYTGGKKITEPYIPGSSLKGKMRSLLEYAFGLIKEQSEIFKGEDKKDIGKPIDSKFVAKCRDRVRDRDDENLQKLQKKAQLIIALFGESADNKNDGSSSSNKVDDNATKNKTTKITRAIFRDSFLTNTMRKLYIEDKIKLTEPKAENTIDRIDSSANPRFMERVPSGLEFDCEIVLRDFGFDDDFLQLLFKNTLHLGLLLLQNDYLGGGGSRGSGRVEFFCEEKLKKIIHNASDAIKKLEDQKNKNGTINDAEHKDSDNQKTELTTLQQAIQKQQILIGCQLELLNSDLSLKKNCKVEH